MKNYYDYEESFDRFLEHDPAVSSRTKTNYLSWLRFLSENYIINENIDEEVIASILSHENAIINSNPRGKGRNRYLSQRDISNFQSALRKFMIFINSTR